MIGLHQTIGLTRQPKFANMSANILEKIKMTEFKRISVAEAHQMIEQGHVVIADIRDDQSFANGHVENSFHLSNASMLSFSQKYDYDVPVLVFCYHGNSSQGAAQYLAQQGYEEVYSVDGGFEMWRVVQPEWIEANV